MRRARHGWRRRLRVSRGRGVDADVVGVAAAQQIARAFAEHAIELVDQQRDRGQGGVGADGGREVGAGEFEASLGGEPAGAAADLAFNVDAKPKDVGFVPEKSFGLGFDERPGGVVEFEVDSPKQQLRFGSGAKGGADHGVRGKGMGGKIRARGSRAVSLGDRGAARGIAKGGGGRPGILPALGEQARSGREHPPGHVAHRAGTAGQT